MDKTKVMIITLLILAIVFSVVSVIISFSAWNFDFSNSPDEKYSDSGQANLRLFVEDREAGSSEGGS